MNAPKGRMLVVDDDMINRTLLQTSLEEQGYEVSTAVDGVDALVQLEASPFDVVLLDLVMPEVDGFEVLARMKAHPELCHVPVIVISGLDEIESIVRSIEAGATDHLPKPFDPVLLRARVNASLAAKRLHDVEASYLREIESLAQQLDVRNRFIQTTFGRYLSDEIVESLLESPERLALGGERRRVTILMSDIRGFSAVAERLAPEQVVRLLNNFLGTMAEVIFEYQGTIDEFIGDAALVLFGAPCLRPDDARRAVACAIAMQKAIERANQVNLAEGLPAVEMGIAVNTGEVVVGNIGSWKRTKYGVVGSHVNLTARIESCTVGGQVLVAQSTLDEAGPGILVGDPIDVKAKGFAEPIRAWDLLGVEGDPALQLDRSEPEPAPISPPLRFRLVLLDGKNVGDRFFETKVVRLSPRIAELVTDAPLEPFGNVRLRPGGANGEELPIDLYGKVLRDPATAAGGWRIRFTSVPPEGRALLDRALAAKIDGL